jgi:hypothetical protein
MRGLLTNTVVINVCRVLSILDQTVKREEKIESLFPSAFTPLRQRIRVHPIPGLGCLYVNPLAVEVFVTFIVRAAGI